MHFDKKMFNYHFKKLYGERLDYAANSIHRIMQEVENILEDYEVNLSTDEFHALCYEIYNSRIYADLDDKILDIVKSKISVK
jgi:hypothetical protein